LAIHFFDENIQSHLKDKRRLAAFIRQLVKQELKVKKITINYVFCNDAYLLEKNIAFLNHDTLTDIITFDLSENAGELQAEIYISVERVEDNAAKFGAGYPNELHRVIFHGVLHLCGYKDKKPEDVSLMRSKESECLQHYFSEN
jgi:rRNA maturation RNase YbeY